jgi:hypothetical protein
MRRSLLPSDECVKHFAGRNALAGEPRAPVGAVVQDERGAHYGKRRVAACKDGQRATDRAVMDALPADPQPRSERMAADHDGASHRERIAHDGTRQWFGMYLPTRSVCSWNAESGGP